MTVALEVIQFVPIVLFAFRFLVAGGVDLAEARGQFVAAALVGIAVYAVVFARKAAPNPILLGSTAWLVVGAVGFGFVPPLAAIVGELAGAGLFLVILATAIGFALRDPRGFVGVPGHPRASWALVALTAVLCGWCLWMRHDIRLGGGLPFIVLNVVRRITARTVGR